MLETRILRAKSTDKSIDPKFKNNLFLKIGTKKFWNATIFYCI